MWIRTVDKEWYIHELKGICYVSWVSEKDKGSSAYFPPERIKHWVSLMKDITGKELEAVEPFV